MSVESPETNTFFYGKLNIMLLFNAYVYLCIIVPTNEKKNLFNITPKYRNGGPMTPARTPKTGT